MTYDLSSKRVAILATDGFEQSELFEPLEALRDSGATVEIVSRRTSPTATSGGGTTASGASPS